MSSRNFGQVFTPSFPSSRFFITKALLRSSQNHWPPFLRRVSCLTSIFVCIFVTSQVTASDSWSFLASILSCVEWPDQSSSATRPSISASTSTTSATTSTIAWRATIPTNQDVSWIFNHQGSISPTFYKQLLRLQIPKVQKSLSS